jgi:hypothetical protein
MSDVENDDYPDEYDGPEFVDNFNDMQRAGVGRAEGGTMKTDLDKNYKTAEELFPDIVSAIAASIVDERYNVLGPKEADENILKNIDNVKNTQYLNPTAFVLGYIASNGGRGITKDRFNLVTKEILQNSSVITDTSVQPEDVLRYARYWERK